MKKGLRRILGVVLHDRCDFNRRPDEEGIKTEAKEFKRQGRGISTADLMKKGLRRKLRHYYPDFWISTADLMKKGLRLPPEVAAQQVEPFQPQT